MTMILIGSPWLAMVPSSGIDIWKPPSPTIAKTSLSGRANCAPIAAGRPKPIEPSPPELIHSRGSLKRMSCAAHIWCWPTSRRDDRLAAGEPVDLRHQVLRLDLACRSSAARSGCSSFQSRICFHQARRAADSFSSAPCRALLQQLVELREHALHVAHDGHVRRAVLADLGRVDIHVDHLGVRREGGQPAGDAVVEAHAERDQQIGVRSCAMFAA